MKNDPLDWNGDHIHTNFKDMYQRLRNNGYYIEVLGAPFTCFDGQQYGTLLIVDSEEEFFPEEITKLRRDIDAGLSLIIFADWYNVSVMKQVKFYDESTKQWWMPDTGGANIPALNDLLAPWGMSFSDEVYEGEFSLGIHEMYYASGTSIAQFPQEGIVVTQSLKNQGQEVLKSEAHIVHSVPILGLYQTKSNKGGRIILYGDSNCLDNSHLQKDCFWMLEAFLEYSSHAHIPPLFMETKSDLNLVSQDLPQRMEGNHLYRYSKVLANRLGSSQARSLPPCPHISWAHPVPLNKSAPTNLYKSQKLLSIGLEAPLPLKHSNQLHPALSNQADLMWENSNGIGMLKSSEPRNSFPILMLVAIVVVLAIIANHLYKHKAKTRRRKPRLRKLLQALNSSRMPAV